MIVAAKKGAMIYMLETTSDNMQKGCYDLVLTLIPVRLSRSGSWLGHRKNGCEQRWSGGMFFMQILPNGPCRQNGLRLEGANGSDNGTGLP